MLNPSSCDGEGSSPITVLMHALDYNISEYRIDIWADANAASTCGAAGGNHNITPADAA